MPMLSPSEVADKWAQRASAAAPDYARGVEQTDKDPTALAAANGARYIAGVQEAYQSGRWARRLAAVGKAGWQAAVRDKGVQNYGTGVAASRQKFETAIGPVLQAVASAQRQVQAMPSATPQQRDARMLAFVSLMRQFGASR
jgi:hypothetical protein